MAQGRKISDQTWDEVVGALRLGVPLGAAAASVGIDASTLSNKRKTDPEYAERCRMAIEEAEGSAARAVSESWRGGDWKAAAFYLERRAGKRWGKRDKLEVAQTVTLEWSSPVRVNAIDVTADVKTLPSPAPEGQSMRLDATLPRDPESADSVTRPPAEGSQGERRPQ